MRRIPIKNCKPGMILGKPVYNDFGIVLIGKDVELTENLINRLLQLEVESVYIEDSRTDDIFVEDVLSDKTREKALKSIKNTFQTLFKEKLVNKPLIKKDMTNVFKPVLENMLYDMKSNKQAMLMLSSIYIKDLYLYTHSLQVALYSISIGMANQYNHQQLIELGLGALLHDIGKTKIPTAFLEKSSALTNEEYELVKKHTTYGFDILRKEQGISLLSAHVAFQHHERLNGSGYPRGLKSEDIHEYAKIVAIADVYDALTSDRVYRKPVLPHEVLEYLYSNAGKEYDRKLLDLFKETVAIYPIGVNVTLSSGENGVVVDINSKYPDRPVVRILEVNGQDLEEPFEIDLSKELLKTIAKCN